MPVRTKLDFEVDVSIDTARQRLRDQTRFRLMPTQARMFGHDPRPLAGVVRRNRFRVAMNRQDVWTRLQAVAVGHLEPTPGGTRVVADVGLPAWLTWYLRLAFILGTLGVGGGIATQAARADALGQLPLIALALGAVLVATSLGIGLNVANADEQVPGLEQALRRALADAGRDEEPLATAAPEAGRALRAEVDRTRS